MKKLLGGGTWGETTGGSYSTHWNFNFSSGKLHEGQKMRLNKPHTHPSLWEIRPGITHQNASHQSCKTYATWSRKQESLTHWHYWALTPCSLGWGMKRLQNKEMVLPAQVCAKPHIPGDHRLEEGMLNFKIFKTYPLFLRRLYSPHKMLFNANPSEPQNTIITVQISGFFKAKSLTGIVMVSFLCQLGWASLQWFHQTLIQMLPWRHVVDDVHVHHQNWSREDHPQHCWGLIHSDEELKSKNWVFLE